MAQNIFRKTRTQRSLALVAIDRIGCLHLSLPGAWIIEIRVLGPLEVWDGDRQLQFNRRQHRLLLGVLAIQANQVVPQERLIDMLWDDLPPVRARAVLQTRASELR